MKSLPGKKVIYSYLRHLVVTAAAIARVYTGIHKTSLYHVTYAELKYVAIALGTSIIPQIRFTALPLAKRLVIKHYPQFAWVVTDAANAADTHLAEIAPTPVQETPTPVEVTQLPEGQFAEPTGVQPLFTEVAPANQSVN